MSEHLMLLRLGVPAARRETNLTAIAVLALVASGLLAVVLQAEQARGVHGP